LKKQSIFLSQKFLLSLFAVFLFILAAPPISWSYLFFIWAVLFWKLEKLLSLKQFILVNTLQHGALFISLFHWLSNVSTFLFLGLLFIYLLFILSFSILLKKTPRKLPVIFIQLYLLSKLTLFPSILMPGYWFYNQPWLIGSVSSWGVVGLSFALWALSWLFFKKRYLQASFIILLLLFLPNNTPSTPPQLNISLVQTKAEATAEDYYRLSNSITPSTNLIVWPETALRNSLRSNWNSSQRIKMFLNKKKIALLLGNVDEKLFSGEYKAIYNSALLINKDGHVTGIHSKNQLLPIMELANYQLDLPYFLRINLPGGHYRSGESSKPLQFKGHSLAVFICYEALFPQLIRNLSYNADIMINVASDGWNTSKTAHLINFIPNIYRAIENNLYLLRVSDTGYTAIISPKGKILSRLDLFTEGILTFNKTLIE